MLRLERKIFVPAAVIVCLACARVTQAAVQQVETNVAYMKTVYSNVSGATYYQPTTHYTSWAPVMVDDIHYPSPQNYLYINRNIDGWFRVDLTGGGTTTVKWMDIIPKYTSYSNWDPYLTQCYLQGLDDTGSLITGYEIEIPAVTLETTQQYSWQTAVNWSGVRYIKLLDLFDGAGDDDLSLSELRVGADVAGYDGFIANVDVTTTSETANLYSAAVNLTNNRGMTDQGGVGVGDPTAQSICSAGNWTSANLLVETEPGSGVYEYAADPVLTFDLGGTYALSSMNIWNYNWANTTASLTYRGTKEALIEYSGDGGATYTALADANGELEQGNYTIPRSPTDISDDSYPLYDSQLTIALGGLEADHVRITSLSNYADDSATISYRGLAEVRFYGEEVTTLVIVPGDADRDGDVDDADAQRLAENWGATTLNPLYDSWWKMGDFNEDEKVNAADAAILTANFGYDSTEGAPVPEPSLMAILLGLPLVLLRRRPK